MQWAPPTPGSGHSALDGPDEAGGSRWPPPPSYRESYGDSPASGPGTSTNTGTGSVRGSLSGPQWTSRDPRTSSSQSLVSSTNDKAGEDRKRKLLVVYIHGFMGNNSSFRSFPAHVHSLLKNLVADTHAIHTKIYPRYKTYKSIDVACDNFSRWLEPHESPTTDVVLIGHSMGGLLAADVVLLVCWKHHRTKKRN
jgi:pimeloyl-ACP methyl ester carboxylesterase